MHPLTERLLGVLALSTVSGVGCIGADATPTVVSDAAGSGGSAGTGGIGSGGTAGSAGSLPVADFLYCTCSSNTVCVLPQNVPVDGSSVPSECPAAANVYTDEICPSSSRVGVWVSDLVRQGPYCCYTLHTQGCIGRPLVVDGELRTSRVVRRDDWRASLPAPAIGLSATVRARLAEAWLDDALLEHASVAAFARFTLELVALGAPADLVRDATAAALDEVEHAKLCFSLASRYAEKTLGPTALDVGGALSTSSLCELAVATFHEGCVGETLAALVTRAEEAELLRQARAEGPCTPRPKAVCKPCANFPSNPRAVCDAGRCTAVDEF